MERFRPFTVSLPRERRWWKPRPDVPLKEYNAASSDQQAEGAEGGEGERAGHGNGSGSRQHRSVLVVVIQQNPDVGKIDVADVAREVAAVLL